MKKWYIGTLVVLLAVLGIIDREQVTLPNQEIVLQFNDVKLALEDTKITIAIVKEELQNVGVHNFQVKENDKGTLKITYYSEADVTVIKRLLSKRIRAELEASSDDDEEAPINFPLHDETIAYNLDVYEIQKTADADSDLNGIAVSELKPKADRFFKPKMGASVLASNSEKGDTEILLALKIHSTIALAIKNTLQYIPEVRAGPAC
ncbi:hypothetical protein [uncultured Algibacter sp.]|uniref:hypothetical protein n=1 Tax=uncultured Algibacter sp. TaxID=298659 RepID=UPI00262EF170|nr:hypothetical protein [uncultured Algibacter sp.]